MCICPRRNSDNQFYQKPRAPGGAGQLPSRLKDLLRGVFEYTVLASQKRKPCRVRVRTAGTASHGGMVTLWYCCRCPQTAPGRAPNPPSPNQAVNEQSRQISRRLEFTPPPYGLIQHGSPDTCIRGAVASEEMATKYQSGLHIDPVLVSLGKPTCSREVARPVREAPADASRASYVVQAASVASRRLPVNVRPSCSQQRTLEPSLPVFTQGAPGTQGKPRR